MRLNGRVSRLQRGRSCPECQDAETRYVVHDQASGQPAPEIEAEACPRCGRELMACIIIVRDDSALPPVHADAENTRERPPGRLDVM